MLTWLSVGNSKAFHLGAGRYASNPAFGPGIGKKSRGVAEWRMGNFFHRGKDTTLNYAAGKVRNVSPTREGPAR
jgi:hypothetical protein